MNIKTFMIEPNEEINILNKERCEINQFSNFQILPFGVSIQIVKKNYLLTKAHIDQSVRK